MRLGIVFFLQILHVSCRAIVTRPFFCNQIFHIFFNTVFIIFAVSEGSEEQQRCDNYEENPCEYFNPSQHYHSTSKSLTNSSSRENPLTILFSTPYFHKSYTNSQSFKQYSLFYQNPMYVEQDSIV